MRGRAQPQMTMLSLQSPEQRVPENHPLREVKRLADEVLAELNTVFDAMYSEQGRKSVPPERLLKASVLMALYSVRSERLFCEQLDYNLLFRWFLDMDMVEKPFDHCAFSDNRDRLLEHEVTRKFFRHVRAEAERRGLTSKDHFTVDGTLIEAWASMKSYRRKDDDDDHDSNGFADFKGKKLSNETHESKTDPEAKLARKSRGQGAKLSFGIHALMENDNGLLTDMRTTEANSRCERTAGLEMLEALPPRARRRTVGGDRGYDTKEFVAGCRELGVTPHVAQWVAGRGNRGSNITAVTTRHPSYKDSQRVRKRVEQIFGWMKTTACFRKTRYRGVARTSFFAYAVGSAYNLVRMAKLAYSTA